MLSHGADPYGGLRSVQYGNESVLQEKPALGVGSTSALHGDPSQDRVSRDKPSEVPSVWMDSGL